MKEFKMRLNPAIAKEGKNNIEKRNTKEIIALIMITSSLIIAEGLVMAGTNIRVISTKKGNEIMLYTDKDIENSKAEGEPLVNYEVKNIKNNRSLKRILRK